MGGELVALLSLGSRKHIAQQTQKSITVKYSF